MKKGTVMSIEKNAAYVFTQDCGLVRMALRPDMAVGREILLNETLDEPTAAPRVRLLKPAFTAAVIIALLTVSLWFGQGLLIRPVYARLSVDVNPSIEMLLNRQLEVEDIRLLNEDAKQLMAGRDMTGLAWHEAVEQWAVILREERPEKLRQMLIAAVMPKDETTFAVQLRDLAGTDNEGALSGIAVRVIYATDQEISNLAIQNGISVGRQMLLNQSGVQEAEWNAASIQSAPVGQLVGELLHEDQMVQDPIMAKIRNAKQTQSGESSLTSQQTTSERTTQGSSNGTSKSTSQGTSRTETSTKVTSRVTTQDPSGSASGTETGSMVTSRTTGSEPSGAAGSEATSSTTGNESAEPSKSSS